MMYINDLFVKYFEEEKRAYRYVTGGVGLEEEVEYPYLSTDVDYDEVESIFEENNIYETEEYKKMANSIIQQLDDPDISLKDERIQVKIIKHLVNEYGEEIVRPGMENLKKIVTAPVQEVEEFLHDFNILYTRTSDQVHGPSSMARFRFETDEMMTDQVKAFFDGLKTRYTSLINQIEDMVYYFPGTNVKIFEIKIFRKIDFLMYSKEKSAKSKPAKTDKYLLTIPDFNYARHNIDKLPYIFNCGIVGISKDGFEVDFDGLNQLMQENGIEAEVLNYTIEDAAEEFYENQFLDMIDDTLAIIKTTEGKLNDILAEIAIDSKEDESSDDSLPAGMLKDITFTAKQTKKVEDAIHKIRFDIKRNFEGKISDNLDSARYYSNGIKIFDVSIDTSKLFRISIKRYLRDDEISQGEESAQGRSFFQN